MAKITSTLRFAALGALVLGFAGAGFVASASAEDATAKGGDPTKPVTDVTSGNGNNSTLRSNDVTDVKSGSGKDGTATKPVTDVTSGNGNNSTLNSNAVTDVKGKDGTTKPVTDVSSGNGNNSTLRSDNVKDVSAGNGGNASNLRGGGLGIGSGGNPTGEGALLNGNCFADMAVYNKDGKFIGRGIVNTCN